MCNAQLCKLKSKENLLILKDKINKGNRELQSDQIRNDNITQLQKLMSI